MQLESQISRVHINTSDDIVKLVLDPLPRRAHSAMGNLEMADQYSYKMALTLEAIWNLRYLVAHKNEKALQDGAILLLE